MTPTRFARRARLLVGAISSILFCSAFLCAETTENIDKTFDAAPGGELIVDVDGGRIDVRGESGSPVRIEIAREVRESPKSKEEEYLAGNPVTIEQNGNTITIRQKKADRKTSWWSSWGRGRKLKAEYTIVVPAEFDADLETSGGPIDVRDLTGEVRADTSGGGISCANINGSVNADTSGGPIKFSNCRGDMRADTSGGGITVEDGVGNLKADTSGGGIRVSRHSGDVDADTSGGPINLDQIDGNTQAHTSGGGIRASLVSRPTGDCRLSTSGGGITVTMPADSTVDLDAATSGGGVSSEFEIPGHDPKNKQAMKGAINGGGPLLHLRSSGGGIAVKSSG